jgi:hypothetical protein
MPAHASWQLDGYSASLRIGALTARLDLRHPQLGLTRLAMADKLVAGAASVLAVCAPTSAPTAPASPLDAYSRGSDLIATYGPTDAHPFRYQAYWRAQPTRYPEALAAVELVVSIQTHLLDSRPRLHVAGLLPAMSGWHWRSAQQTGELVDAIDCPPIKLQHFGPAGGIGCFRFRLAGSDLDYAEIVHPVDFQSSSLDVAPLDVAAGSRAAASGAERSTLLSHQLFTGQLEKGVILRSRVLGLFLPASAPRGMIAEYYRSFVEEQLPLTT